MTFLHSSRFRASGRTGSSKGRAVDHGMGVADELAGRPLAARAGDGAIATGRIRVLDEALVRHLGIDPSAIDAVTAQEMNELARCEAVYRGTRPPPRVAGRNVVLVDDGLARAAA